MGQKCEEVCPEGFYGSNCFEICQCNRKPNFVCHPAHGCVCKTGYKGSNCDVSLVGELTSEEGEFISWFPLNFTNIKLYGEEMNFITLQSTAITPESVETDQNTIKENPLPVLDIKIAATSTVPSFINNLATEIIIEATTSQSTLLSTSSSAKESITDSTPFTFHPLATTTQLSNQLDVNVKVTTENAISTSPSLQEDKTDSSFSTGGLTSSTPPSATSFFSDNPNNVLIVSTTNSLETSDLSNYDFIATTVKPVDENDVEIADSIQSGSKKTSTEEHDNENESNDNTVNEVATEAGDLDFPASTISDVTEASVDDHSSFSTSLSNNSDVTLSTKGPQMISSTISEEETGYDKQRSTTATSNPTVSDTIPTEAQSNNPDESQEDDIAKFIHELLYDRNDTQVVNISRKHRMRNFFYYYFITAIKNYDSNSSDVNRTIVIREEKLAEAEDEERKKQEKFLGLPGDRL